MTITRSYYELLGVPSSADASTLRSAFRRLSKVLHPDTTSLPTKEAASRFQEICQAYETLNDPILRAAYDTSLSQQALKQTSDNLDLGDCSRIVSEADRGTDVRRPFSGGELFSLLMLGFAFLVCLLLGIGFALGQGRELQVLPSWLLIE